MPEPDRPENPPPVHCGACAKEVPPSEAKSVEGQNYMMYFCGLDCYEEWRKRQPPSQGPQHSH